ncbi:hypothetical protein SSX86_027178 [Deinandra increscens subsp. villosa]|uniref:Cyclin-like domain-containing protein n=1 Tax=Deinandra increscens subsp. villosa TaxID=3103831 RepID=A0AAP0CLD0_9ASTR
MSWWCSNCAQDSETRRDHTDGCVFCVDCGEVLYQDGYSATFDKYAAGWAHLTGNLVTVPKACFEPHRRTLDKGEQIIYRWIHRYGIIHVGHATKYFEIAVERGFTRGRKTRHVAMACLYVACREMEKPFLLIEFSADVGVSVYEFSTMYLQLCKLLGLQDRPFVHKPVDPSLFMCRSSGLPQIVLKAGNQKKVLNTALHLAVSMKRDWIKMGRKPSGTCAADIYVSSALHGYIFSKTNSFIKTAHIGEATLTKRLIEFEVDSITIEEFTRKAMDFQTEIEPCKLFVNHLTMPAMTAVVCQHKSSEVQSCFGLCKDCYLGFCGGLDGFEPSTSQRVEVERLPKESMKKLSESTPQEAVHSENLRGSRVNWLLGVCDKILSAPNSGELDETSDTVDSFESSKESPADETDTLSDIDDSEVIGYLLEEEESRLKIIWEHMNRKHMQEEADKKAARKLYTGKSDERRQAQTLKKKKDKRKRELEAKPAQTATEDACQHSKKRLSLKINYDAVTHLFGDEEASSGKNRVNDGGSPTKEKEIASEGNNNEMYD